MDLVALKNELTIDPLGRGYAAMDDQAAADAVNAENRQISRETIHGGMLAASIAKAEYTALGAADKAYVNMLIPAGDLPLTQTLKTELASIFPATGPTRANLLAAVKRQGHRGDELGLGRVTPSDVAAARKLS